MKKIFADPLNKVWHSVFIDLAEQIGGKAYPQFIAETEPLYADVIIVDSFDDVIEFERLYGSLNLQNNPFLFIVSTQQDYSSKIGGEKVLPLNDTLCICDLEMIAQYISSIVMPWVIKRETMLAKKPHRIFTHGLSSLEYFFDKFEPNFDDGCDG